MSSKTPLTLVSPLVSSAAPIALEAATGPAKIGMLGTTDESASLEATEALAPAAPAATTPLAWALLILLACIWGTSFILMKKGLVVFSALELGAIRVGVAALLLLPFALRYVGSVERGRLKWLALSGVVGTLLPAFLFAYAETKLASGLAGVLNALTAVFTLLVGALLFGQRLTGPRVLGIGLGLVGTVVMLQLGGSGGDATPAGEGNAWYGLYILVATIGYGLSVNVIKHKLGGLSPIAVTSLLLMLIGGPALAFLLLGTGFVHKQHRAGGLDGLRLHRAAGHHEHGRGHGAVQQAYSAIHGAVCVVKHVFDSHCGPGTGRARWRGVQRLALCGYGGHSGGGTDYSPGKVERGCR